MATSQYREDLVRFVWLNRVPHGAFERLEPRDAKVSSAVLRGRGASNGSLLPGLRHEVVQVFVMNNPMFCYWYPTGACVIRKTVPLGRWWGAKPPGQCIPHSFGVVTEARVDVATASIEAVGG